MAGFKSIFTGSQIQDAIQKILNFFSDDWMLEKIVEKEIITPFGEEDSQGQAILYIDDDSTDEEKILLVM